MNRADIVIRQAVDGEAPVLASIIRQAFHDVALRFNLTPENCPKHPSNCTDDWIIRDWQRGVVYYLLELGGLFAGCVAMERAGQGLIYLERLAVLPDYRRGGFGKRLVDHVFCQAKAMGAERMGIGIIAAQDDLKAWYRQIGFSEKDTKHFDHLPFDVTFLEYDFCE